MQVRFMAVIGGVMVIMAGVLTGSSGDQRADSRNATSVKSATDDTVTAARNEPSGGLVMKAARLGIVQADSDDAGMPDHAAAQENAPGEKEDDDVRALFALPDGQLTVKPSTHAYVHALGAQSCYGTATDLSWQGDYEAVWEPAGGEAASIMTFADDFSIVQPNDKPATMQHVKAGDTDLLVYVPRYTDCHALETYVFGVQDGKAFPVPFLMSDDKSSAFIGQLPQHPLQAKGEELVFTGGYSAGDDTIPVMHFRYDGERHALVLTQIGQGDGGAR